MNDVSFCGGGPVAESEEQAHGGSGAQADAALSVRVGDRTVSVTVTPGQTLAQAVWLSGLVPPAALCSGLGRCGACRVRFLPDMPGVPEPGEVEREVLGPEALEQGWRLACRHRAAAGMAVAVPDPGPDAARPEEPLSGEVCLAVDLGTTSVWWKAVGSEGQRSGKFLNPQLGAGSDVMSRIAMALDPAGRGRLRELVLDRLRDLVRQTGASRLCVAGNTAMTAILLDRDCAGLAAAPYTLPESGNRDVILPGLPPVWIPPQAAPFVGGDISAGLAAVLAGSASFPLLLADMGTNGEFALMPDAHTLWLTSVPLGPSLEGIGLRHGTMAGPGAVTDFALGPQGLVPDIRPGAPVRGISGTGYLSLLHILRRQGVLDEQGGPVARPPSPLAQRLSARIVREKGPWYLPLSHGLSLAAEDVEELVKVRAAFSLAVASLLAHAGLRPESLAAVYLAGALGEHVSAAALEGLGFLPAGLGARLHAAGNASLSGAEWLLRHPEQRPALARLCARARVPDLVAAPDFMENYVARMRLTAFAF